MDIKRNGSQASAIGPTDWFTGSVRIDAPFQTSAPARVSGAAVTFEPGARTAWHTHPLGQTLVVTFGWRPGATRGWANRGNPRRRHRVVSARREALARRCADHRYDAPRHRGSLDGNVVNWMEKVSDE